MRHRLVVPVVLGVAFLVAGCATKKFVREELDKSEATVGQRTGQEVARLERELSQGKAQLSGVEARVTETRAVADEATRKADQATGVAGQAATKADDAISKAAQAVTKADEAAGAAGQALAKVGDVDGRLSRLAANRNKRNLTDTVVVLFAFDKWQLDDRAQTVLLEVVTQLQANPNLVVDLEGYTDNVGPLPYNVGLSQRRAEAVRRFLVEKGIELHRVQSIGLGDIRPVAANNTKEGRDQNRRVAVKLFTPAE